MLMLGSTGAHAAGSGQPDSLGTEFWIGFPANIGTPDLTLFVSGPRATTGTVSSPAFADIAFSVTPGTVTSIGLPSSVQMAVDSGAKEAKGIHVQAGDEVSVYGLNRIVATTDAYMALPVDVLDTHHIVMAYPATAGAEAAVVAAHDGTDVVITPSADTDHGTAGTPIAISMDAGETYAIHASSGGDLTGTTITSNLGVSVFGGNECAYVPQGTPACDHIVEQIPGTSTWGKDFLTVPLKTRIKGDTVRMLAAEDATEVRVDGSVVKTLNKGAVHEMIITAASRITADKPILVAQFSNGQQFDGAGGVPADPFMMLIPPKEQYLAAYTFATPADGFASNFVNVTVPTGAIASVRIDGSAVPAGEFAAIGATGFSGAQITLASGSHTFTSGAPAGIFVYGFDSYDSYGYPGGASFAPVSQATGIALTPASSTAVIGTQVCLATTVTDQGGQPLAGIRVDVVRTGVNPGSDFGFTDAAGVSQHCYTGTAVGQDTVSATVGTLGATATVTWTSGTVTPPQQPQPPPTVQKLETKVSAVSDKSKFKLQVLTVCSGQYSFRIAKRKVTTISQGSDESFTKVTWKKLPKRYKTVGSKHTKTVNLPKGRYRAVVTGKCGYETTTTKSVTLKK